MDLRLAALLLFLCAAITTTQGSIPKCCVVISKHVPRRMLLKVEKYEVQSSSGVCEIDALILHVKGRKYCAPPKMKRLLKKVQKRKGRKKNLNWIQKKFLET